MTFLSHDRIVRATSDASKFRLVLVDATRAAQEISDKHEAKGYAAQLLGESIASALLLASDLKGQGTVQLRFSLSGDISRVNADATPFGLVRAMIPRDEILKMGSFEPMVLPQTLRVIKLDRDGHRISEGVVEMVDADISSSMRHYLKQSEQGVYMLRVQARYDESTSQLAFAGGILLEAFPGFTPAEWTRIEALANTVDLADHVRPEDKGLHLGSLLETFDRAAGIKIHKEFEVESFCPCTEQGVLRALSSLGRQGLESLFLENREAEMFCEFCRKRYVVSVPQILGLLNEAEEAEIMGKTPEAPEAESEEPGLPDENPDEEK
jgi:molecular chaperone Hsp33